MKKGLSKLRWKESLYRGETVENLDAIKQKLDAGKWVRGVYLVTLSNNQDNMLEIFSAGFLKQPAFRSLCPLIVGIAKGKDEAISLVQKIIEETYQATGKCNVPEYLKNR